MTGILVLGATIYGVWWLWGFLFEGKKSQSKMKVNVMYWKAKTKELLKDPDLSEEDRRSALKDIEMYDKILKFWSEEK